MSDSRLGKYEITGVLGKGAMGTVYDARDPVIERRVAIKTFTLPDAADTEAQEELARFKREAQAAGRLHHPNIVGVYDYGETATLAYIVMEYVDGSSLKTLLERDERFPPSETARLIAGLLAGLHYSHERGVVHRDIKPANIMVTAAGVPKIADFGIARIESSSMTQAGTIMGTPAYMSPEQFMGNTVDARTDIYSAGAVLYQMLTGEKPFSGSQTAIMHKALNTVPPRPSELSVTAPPGLDAVVATAMAKRPEDRFATATAFAEALARGMTAAAGRDDDATQISRPVAPAIIRQPDAPAPRPDAPRRGGLLIAAAVAAVVLLAGGGYLALSGSAPTPVPPATPAPPALAMSTPSPAAAPTPAPAPTPPVPTPGPAPAAPSPPVAPPAPVAEQHAELGRTPEALRQAVAAAVGPVPCALLQGDVLADGAVAMKGVAAADAEPALRQALRDGAGPAPVDWRIATFRGPYCPVLDALRPVAARFGAPDSGVGLVLKGGTTLLHKDQYLVPVVTMPEFPANLLLDYFTSDGSLAHLAFAAKGPLAPRRTVTVGDPRPADPASNLAAVGVPGWQIDVPFGTDLIVAVASDRPLFDKPRPDTDTATAYLHDLRAAIEAVQRRGGHVAGAALVVQTSEK